ncbi:MAG: cyclic nucleotide-binding domain-containing protein [Rhizobiales bacterium]|nr:cyclic nucleotide-binding domain-containing protein [Hyphomicrobiales bacterium]
MRPHEIEQIKSSHLFHDMADEHFSSLVTAAYLQRFPAHVQLLHEGDRPDFLHILLEGGVELYSRHDGRETIIAIIRPVTTFILAAVVGDFPYLASARTLEAARILLIPAESVRAIADKDAAFSRSLVRELSLAFRGVMRELKNQKLRNSAERLANWIIRTDSVSGRSGRFTIPHDKRRLASLLGMSPENLSRSLVTVSGHGVKLNGRTVVIEEPDRLATFAKPSTTIDEAEN